MTHIRPLLWLRTKFHPLSTPPSHPISPTCGDSSTPSFIPSEHLSCSIPRNALHHSSLDHLCIRVGRSSRYISLVGTEASDSKSPPYPPADLVQTSSISLSLMLFHRNTSYVYLQTII